MAEDRILRWLHLSDFHFRDDERWDRRTTLQALLRAAEGLKEEGLRPDLVFLTGDVANTGQRGEFDQGIRFFHELAKTLEFDDEEMRQCFFVVPGNHDVDRGAIGPADDLILAGLQDQEAIERVLGDRPTMDLLGARRAVPATGKNSSASSLPPGPGSQPKRGSAP